MFPGYKLTIEGVDYLVPALSLGQIRNGVKEKLKEHDQAVAEGKTFEVQLLRGEVILEAIRRNYPAFLQETLENNLDLNAVGKLWLVVLGASGFIEGEIVAATTTAGT